MSSSAYIDLHNRIQELKKRYLPPTKKSGIYTEPEQDQLRALRLLAHAEIEQFLENYSQLLAEDIQRELKAERGGYSTAQKWALNAVKTVLNAIPNNNGVKADSIKLLFSPLGVDENDYNSVSPVFLDRITTFGKHRGDVAHRSAIGAKHQLNRVREEKFLDEIIDYLDDFDRLLIKKRLRGLLP